MEASLLIDSTGHLYNILNMDPVVFNFSSIGYGVKVRLEDEIDAYMETSPPDRFNLCIIVANESYTKYSTKFQSFLHIHEQHMADCIVQYPLIKEGDEYLSKPSILLQANNPIQTTSLPPIDLYIGTFYQLKELKLSKYFDVVVNVTQHTFSPNDNNCAYHHIPMEDNVFFDITDALQQSEAIFQQCKPHSKCIVFCDKGCSRSATIILHQLLLRCKPGDSDSSTNSCGHWKVSTMLQEVKRIYPKIQPNEGFLCQLRFIHDHR
eukprot:gene25968-31359_t